jgi:hypothetical protein
VVESFGSQNGFVVGVASCAEKLPSMRSFAGFPISLKTVACRFQSLECRSEPWAGFDRSDELFLQRSVFVKNGAKGEVVAGNKVIEAVRWISYQTGLADVRNKAYDVNGAGATVGAISGWSGWRC